MDNAVRKRLEAADFVETTVEELFGLTPEKARLVETKVRLSQLLYQRRLDAGMKQEEIATKVGTSQSRISVLEKMARTRQNVSEISVDTMLKTLFSMGASDQDIARTISGELSQKAIT